MADRRGAAAVELALVMPMLIAMMMAVVAYGDYFWRAHALQEVASSAVRSAIGGVTPAERRRFVDDTIAAEAPQLGGITATRVVRALTDTGTSLTLDLSYDASRDLLLSGGLMPMPRPVIRRRAVILLGGL